jgi:hypothetical protein
MTSETMLSQWLATDERDAALEGKLETAELYRLVQSHLGLTIEPGAPIPGARHQTLRYVLAGEFRGDLKCAPPPSLATVPEATTQEQRRRVHDLAAALRNDHGDEYPAIADGIEAELELANADIDAAALGSVDTFRFEERRLLGHAATLVADGEHAAALEIVTERGRSFWVGREIGRMVQWEACRLMAELARRVRDVGSQMPKVGHDPRAWIEVYAGGWFEVDRAQRMLEGWVAKMEDELEPALESAHAVVSRAHEALLEGMAQKFSAALESSKWSIDGVLHQTSVFPALVDPAGGRVAYFLVDSLRYEMGADLVEQLEGAPDLRIVPAVAALPTVTPIGMAALLPGASASFSVVEHEGGGGGSGVGLAARIDANLLPGSTERMKYLRAVRPDARDIDLEDLLQRPAAKVGESLEGARIVVVRSQEIDELAEKGGGHLARQTMETVVANIARAVRKLSRLGIEHFVITADHGHQLAVREDEDTTVDTPAGDTVDQHGRCWAGRGGETAAGCVRATSADLGYESDLDYLFPKGLAVFRSGGDLAYHHGGISLQEVVIPVITLRAPGIAEANTTSTRLEVKIEGWPETLTNRTFGMRVYVAREVFEEPVDVRLVMLAGGQEVGRAGMALDAELDRATGIVKVPPGGKVVTVAMLLTRGDVDRVRIVALDPATDTVLAQSNEIEVRLI